MLLALLLQNSCYSIQFDVPQERNVRSNVYVAITERGLQKYGQLNLNKAFEGLINSDFGDLNFSVLSCDFRFHHLKITELQNPAISLHLLPEQNAGDLKLANMSITLHFEFTMQSSIIASVNDLGEGKIKLTISDIGFLASGVQSPDCPGELNILTSQSVSRVSELLINFDSDYSFLYNAVMPMLTDYLKELFNEKFAPIFVEQFTKVANEHLDELSPSSHVNSDALLNFDQRYIGGVTVVDRQFYISTSGVACNRPNDKSLCSGWQEAPDYPRCPIIVNADITYKISKHVFTGAYSYIWQFNQSYIEATWQIANLSVRVEKVAKNGLVLNVSYLRDGQNRSFQGVGKLKTKQQLYVDGSITVAWFSPSLSNVTACGNEELDYAKRLAVELQPLLDGFAFTITNGYDIDLQNASIYYCDENWVLVGASIRPDYK